MLGAIVAVLSPLPERTWAMIALRGAFLVVVGAVAWYVPLWVRRFTPDYAGRFEARHSTALGGYTLRPTADGMVFERAGKEFLTAWGVLRRVDVGEEGIYAFQNARQAFVIPKRAFPDAAAAEEFARFAEARVAEAHRVADGGRRTSN